MELVHLIQISISAILINNIILMRFLGLCPFFGVSRNKPNAFGMGVSVIVVMTLATLCTWPINNYILIPFEVEYLKTIVFILIIASLVQLLEIIVERYIPALHNSLGIYLPLITTNCAILGVALLNVEPSAQFNKQYTLIEALVHAGMSGVGFTLALILMAGIRERLSHTAIPKPLRGLPIAFIVAGLMSMAFFGFSDLSIFHYPGR